MKQLTKTLRVAGRDITFKIGGLAPQATAAVLTQYGETSVLTTVVVGRENKELDYFPLSVEYVEKLYAGGRIKGSRWVKREGRPNDSAILVSRLIDRSVRPLFDPQFRRDVQIINTLLSIDDVNSPEVVAALGTACALSLCTIPWNGPIATTQVGYITNGNPSEGSYVLNPKPEEDELSSLDLTVSSTAEKVVMIEARAEEIGNGIVVEGIKQAKAENAQIIAFFEELRKERKVENVPFVEDEDAALIKKVVHEYEKELKAYLQESADKENVDNTGTLLAEIAAKHEIDEDKQKLFFPKVLKKVMKLIVFEDSKRADGRAFDEVRELEAEVGIIPRVHGSALFRRGATQVLSIATLGPLSQRQWIENPEGEYVKRYIHHYCMPPYSVGETGRIGTPNRREIGHGALAEKAIEVLLPNEDTFPYTVRIVSEVLSSNGSTSMASTCASSLALMDAGVPMPKSIGGIAIGIVRDGDNYQLLTDIVGIEDFYGEMDFKVAGSTEGITAIQLDVKNDGITDEQIEGAIVAATKARTTVLAVMDKTLAQPRTAISKYAPRVVIIIPPEDKIGEIIGPGGKNIKKIIADTGAEVDIDENGKVSISGIDPEAVEKAVAMVKDSYKVYSVGEEYDGIVIKVLLFGGVVRVAPGKEGLLHVSQMGMGFVKDANEVLKEGQNLRVKISEVDDRGRMKFALVKNE